MTEPQNLVAVRHDNRSNIPSQNNFDPHSMLLLEYFVANSSLTNSIDSIIIRTYYYWTGIRERTFILVANMLCQFFPVSSIILVMRAREGHKKSKVVRLSWQSVPPATEVTGTVIGPDHMIELSPAQN